MSCNHINDQEQEIDYVCQEWRGEEGCEFAGVVVAKECSGTWYVTCPKCKEENQNDYL